MSSFKKSKSKGGVTKEGRLQAKINKKASKARELRRLADASERNNFSGKISEGKAERMRKKAAKLSAKSKKIHNTKKETPSQKDYANRAKNQKLREQGTKTPLKMKNAINSQFKMTPGSKEIDTPGTFKNSPAVMSMGAPTNYGTPMKKTDPKKETDAERRNRLSLGEKGSDRGAGGQRTFAGGKIKANIGKERGATDLLEEGKKVYRKVKKSLGF